MRPRQVIAAASLLLLPVLAAAPADAGPVAGATPGRPGLTPSVLIPTAVSGFPGKAVTIAPGKTWTARVTVSGPRARLVLLQRLSSGRWVAVKSVRTTARKVAAFTVAQPRAGTFRYRIVVPRVGLFAARTTGIKVVTVKKVELRLVPSSITGTFTGTQYLGAKNGVSAPFLTWTGNATFSQLRRSGSSYHYRLTALSASWSINTSDAECTYVGSGSFTLVDADVSGFDATYEPWGPFEPGRYSLDVVLKTGVARFPYHASCSFDYEYDSTLYSQFRAAELLRVSRSGVMAPGATVVGGWPRTSDPEVFAGSIAAAIDSASGDNTWSFVGENPFPFPRP